MELCIYPNKTFNIHVLKIEYDYGCKPLLLLNKLNELGFKENGLVRNPLMELPGTLQEYSVCMDSGSYNSTVLSKIKTLAKSHDAPVKVLRTAPAGKF